MNNDRIYVEERSRDIGDFLVGRLLPMRKKRQVGPFTFIDHMGPTQLGNGKFMDVDQHPHIGLSTLTYLFEGAIHHQDSTGSNQIVSAGDVGFMTAGKGVTHTERTPAHLRNNSTFQLHGYQIWVALPKELEEKDPEFEFLSANQLPTCEQDGLKIKLVAGSGFGLTSPLTVFSPLFMVDIYAEKAQKLSIHDQLEGEIAVVVVKGEAKSNEHTISAGAMLISKTENECELELAAHTQLLLFGGEPLPEERFLLWNFVSSSKERLQKAQQDWMDKKFPKIETDNTYIPFP